MIHRLSDVQTDNVGENTLIWQFTVVLKGAVIGDNCNINCHVFIENDVVIGNNVTVKSGVYLWDGIQIEDDVFVGPNATFTNDLVPRPRAFSEGWKENPSRWGRTLLKKGASVGANSTIVAGVTIGEYALIGAGSVVTKDVPRNTLWYGNPARHCGYVTKNGITLNLQFKDKEGNSYKTDMSGDIILENE